MIQVIQGNKTPAGGVFSWPDDNVPNKVDDYARDTFHAMNKGRLFQANLTSRDCTICLVAATAGFATGVCIVALCHFFLHL